MKGNPEIIKLLNAVLTNELTAINQYFLHARMLQSWGLNHLGDVVYKESIGEMKHADMLIKRVLFLEGLPNLQELHKLSIGETVPECLQADLSVEIRGRATLIDAIKTCEAEADFVSRQIFQQILSDTETHIDFLENQLGLIRMLGEANYLQTAMGDIQTDDAAVGG